MSIAPEDFEEKAKRSRADIIDDIFKCEVGIVPGGQKETFLSLIRHYQATAKDSSGLSILLDEKDKQTLQLYLDSVTKLENALKHLQNFDTIPPVTAIIENSPTTVEAIAAFADMVWNQDAARANQGWTRKTSSKNRSSIRSGEPKEETMNESLQGKRRKWTEEGQTAAINIRTKLPGLFKELADSISATLKPNMFRMA